MVGEYLENILLYMENGLNGNIWRKVNTLIQSRNLWRIYGESVKIAHGEFIGMCYIISESTMIS